MLYNSLQFLFFYIIVTLTYWFTPGNKRWVVLLAASCYFYMSFVPAYILILGFTIGIDYFAGIFLEKTTKKSIKKVLLIVSLVANIGILAFFKYFNFFNAAVDNLLGAFSFHTPFPFLKILLPIGLSFHTFQAMSYTIEVYRGNHKAEQHFGIYALYVMFYPQLVAGPIERPQNVLWQFHQNHTYSFENLKAGLMQMAFGLFKKVVIADRVSEIVDTVYANPHSQNGKTIFIAAILYSFQIYCDFSGYSDIGIGAAKTMGYKLVTNFNTPYLSKSISEFWSRWHISLSTWFRDYLYIPLGGSRVNVSRKYLNLMIVFLISGLWHGANWTFVIWGALHGVLLIIENIKNSLFKMRKATGINNWLIRTINALGVFLLVTLAWIFFRAPSVKIAWLMLSRLFSNSFFNGFNYDIANPMLLFFTFVLIALLLIKEYYFLIIPTKNNTAFYMLMMLILASCYLFGVFNNQQFIYFQF